MKLWKRRTSKIVAGVALVLGMAVWGVGRLQAQQPGFKRVELQRHDIGVPGRELILARGEFDPGAAVPKHTHPGEEVAYVLDGEVTVEMAGKPPIVLKPGDVFFVPAGTVHTAKNTGKTTTKVLSTYVVEKGKPLATLMK
jgi:quercetin dioxygenase-like cupin family protein